MCLFMSRMTVWLGSGDVLLLDESTFGSQLVSRAHNDKSLKTDIAAFGLPRKKTHNQFCKDELS